MTKKKISVIMSVYNTEKYLKDAIESVLNQEYTPLELIIVDDKSTDHSTKILKEYENNKRVTVLYNTENKGAGYSKNKALSKASGEYIGFVDSDDTIPKDYYQRLMQQIEQKNADLALCDIKLVPEKKEKTMIIMPAFQNEFTKINVIDNSLAASCCNKLFHKSLFQNLSFPEGKMNEDVPVVIPAIVKAKSIAYEKDLYYNYLQRSDSIQHKKFSNQRFDIFEMVDLTLERIKNVKEYKEIEEILVYNQLIALFIYVFPEIESFKERYNYLKKFSELGKKYHFTQNHHFWQFLNRESKKNRLYYKMIFFLQRKGRYFLCNSGISMMRIYKKYFNKSVIEKVTLDMLIKSAQKQQKKKEESIKISVIVPNYNYEKFLYERIYSILNQKAKIYELILLDDVSTDNSRELINEIIENLSPYIKIKKNYNKINSGSPFKQWQKGFELAKGDYVWIAEADDYCDKRMLSSLSTLIKKEENIRIAYVDTAFINAEGKIILPSVRPLIDLMETGHWDHSYINDGKEEFQNYSFLNCTIANVSSVLFKKDEYQELFKLSGQYRQAGDYLFYVNIMNLGKIAYVNKAYNFYRIHGNNVTSTTKKEQHLDELIRIHNYFDKTYHLNKKQKERINERYEELKTAWQIKKD